VLALLEQLRQPPELSKKGARARLSLLNSLRRPLRPTPAPRTKPTAINSNEKCKKMSSFFLMGSLGDRPVNSFSVRGAQASIFPLGASAKSGCLLELEDLLPHLAVLHGTAVPGDKVAQTGRGASNMIGGRMIRIIAATTLALAVGLATASPAIAIPPERGIPEV
jgi:hypothetical protein